MDYSRQKCGRSIRFPYYFVIVIAYWTLFKFSRRFNSRSSKLETNGTERFPHNGLFFQLHPFFRILPNSVIIFVVHHTTDRSSVIHALDGARTDALGVRCSEFSESENRRVQGSTQVAKASSVLAQRILDKHLNNICVSLSLIDRGHE